MCKRSDAFIQVAFEFIMAQLKKRHSQVSVYDLDDSKDYLIYLKDSLFMRSIN